MQSHLTPICFSAVEWTELDEGAIPRKLTYSSSDCALQQAFRTLDVKQVIVALDAYNSRQASRLMRSAAGSWLQRDHGSRYEISGGVYIISGKPTGCSADTSRMIETLLSRCASEFFTIGALGESGRDPLKEW
jgi:hypothetical protein